LKFALHRSHQKPDLLSLIFLSKFRYTGKTSIHTIRYSYYFAVTGQKHPQEYIVVITEKYNSRKNHAPCQLLPKSTLVPVLFRITHPDQRDISATSARCTALYISALVASDRKRALFQANPWVTQTQYARYFAADAR
jgi:hypothetical protein